MGNDRGADVRREMGLLGSCAIGSRQSWRPSFISLHFSRIDVANMGPVATAVATVTAIYRVVTKRKKTLIAPTIGPLRLP
jgi:hypothetical protein